ncbi:MAG: hypothetical protein K2L19_04710 [Eubacterium sp.]|nr:hypothetical protein [Eubacterium sp.]
MNRNPNLPKMQYKSEFMKFSLLPCVSKAAISKIKIHLFCKHFNHGSDYYSLPK